MPFAIGRALRCAGGRHGSDLHCTGARNKRHVSCSLHVLKCCKVMGFIKTAAANTHAHTRTHTNTHKHTHTLDNSIVYRCAPLPSPTLRSGEEVRSTSNMSVLAPWTKAATSTPPKATLRTRSFLRKAMRTSGSSGAQMSGAMYRYGGLRAARSGGACDAAEEAEEEEEEEEEGDDAAMAREAREARGAEERERAEGSRGAKERANEG